MQQSNTLLRESFITLITLVESLLQWPFSCNYDITFVNSSSLMKYWIFSSDKIILSWCFSSFQPSVAQLSSRVYVIMLSHDVRVEFGSHGARLLQMSQFKDGFLNLFPAVHWLLFNDFEPLPVDAVTSFSLVSRDQSHMIKPPYLSDVITTKLSPWQLSISIRLGRPQDLAESFCGLWCVCM